jgi:arsenate reductase-like glutaredoxin family protein
VAKVTVYSQPHCAPCAAEKAWFHSEHVAFEDRDVSSNPAWLEELLALGSQSTPTTVVEAEDGRQVVIGFDRPRLRTLLGS